MSSQCVNETPICGAREITTKVHTSACTRANVCWRINVYSACALMAPVTALRSVSPTRPPRTLPHPHSHPHTVGVVALSVQSRRGWSNAHLKVHVRVERKERAFVLHAPLELHHHRLANQPCQVRLWVARQLCLGACACVCVETSTWCVSFRCACTHGHSQSRCRLAPFRKTHVGQVLARLDQGDAGR